VAPRASVPRNSWSRLRRIRLGIAEGEGPARGRHTKADAAAGSAGACDSWREAQGNLRRIRENALVMRRDVKAARARTAELRTANEHRRRACFL
jgi:hypothetical protein